MLSCVLFADLVGGGLRKPLHYSTKVYIGGITIGVAAMSIKEILNKRHADLKAGIAVVEHELREIEAALKAIESVTPSAPSSPAQESSNRFDIRHSMPVNDAVVLAVNAGCKTPMEILKYLQNQLGIMTTINSVRSRVSPLKAEGKIKHDGTGWVPSGYDQHRLNV